jgi:hypothetical protein
MQICPSFAVTFHLAVSGKPEDATAGPEDGKVELSKFACGVEDDSRKLLEVSAARGTEPLRSIPCMSFPFSRST